VSNADGRAGYRNSQPADSRKPTGWGTP